MPSVVFDASSPVGALLKEGSAPERALLLARSRDVICISKSVEDEVRDVFSRPKFRKYLTPGRAERILELISAAALPIEPAVAVTDCRDPKDNKYLELALAAGADTIVSSDDDLLALHPRRGVEIISPAEYVARLGSAGAVSGEAMR